MPGMYDQLLDQLGDDDNDRSSGLTPLDIADLPDAPRKVMFAMLRDAEAATEGLTLDHLQAKLANVPGLAEVLAELTQKGWLILRGEPPAARYKVNLRRRRGREVSADVWASLADHLADAADSDQDDPGEDPDSGSSAGKPRLPVISDW